MRARVCASEIQVEGQASARRGSTESEARWRRRMKERRAESGKGGPRARASNEGESGQSQRTGGGSCGRSTRHARRLGRESTSGAWARRWTVENSWHGVLAAASSDCSRRDVNCGRDEDAGPPVTRTPPPLGALCTLGESVAFGAGGDERCSWRTSGKSERSWTSATFPIWGSASFARWDWPAFFTRRQMATGKREAASGWSKTQDKALKAVRAKPL